MDRGNAGLALDVAMQYRDITEADQPLWVFLKVGKMKTVYNPHESISATSHNNSFDFRIVQGGLKIIGPQSVIAGKLMVPCIKGITDDKIEIPTSQQIKSFFQIGLDITCGTYQCNFIAGPEKWRDLHRSSLSFFS